MVPQIPSAMPQTDPGCVSIADAALEGTDGRIHAVDGPGSFLEIG